MKRIADALDRLLVEAYGVYMVAPAADTKGVESTVDYSSDLESAKQELLAEYEGKPLDAEES